MFTEGLRSLLAQLQEGEVGVEQVLERLKTLPYDDLGFANVDHHRALRRGFPEVIFGLGKTPSQVAALFERLSEHNPTVLCTRANVEQAQAVQKVVPHCVYEVSSQMLYVAPDPIPERGRGTIVVVCAGTSDIPVAQEAVLTARLLGNRVETLFDVGVAGLHRLLPRLELLRAAEVLIVVAGMEGALPSVVGGLCDRPLIALPTSVGYGTGAGGFAALLGMLNSCSAGITVVNIDNGFGAGYAASLINRRHPGETAPAREEEARASETAPAQEEEAR